MVCNHDDIMMILLPSPIATPPGPRSHQKGKSGSKFKGKRRQQYDTEPRRSPKGAKRPEAEAMREFSNSGEPSRASYSEWEVGSSLLLPSPETRALVLSSGTGIIKISIDEDFLERDLEKPCDVWLAAISLVNHRWKNDQCHLVAAPSANGARRPKRRVSAVADDGTPPDIALACVHSNCPLLLRFKACDKV